MEYMEYFYISRDRRYRDTPYIQDFHLKYHRYQFCPEKSHKIQERNVVYSQSEKVLAYTDILSGPVFLVSEQVKRVMEAYEDGICFKMFYILNTLADQGRTYYAPILPAVRCLREGKEGGQTRLVLDHSLVEGRHICQAEGEAYWGGLIISLAVTESLLRRRLLGIHYQRLEVR